MENCDIFLIIALNRVFLNKTLVCKKYIPVNNNEKFRSFKSKENIHKKEVGPYRGFGY